MENDLFQMGKATQVKICGLTRREDAFTALDAGADFIGFVFYPQSPRFCPPDAARRILEAARGEFGAQRVRAVGVFVNSALEKIRETARVLELAAVQLHGEENLAMLRALSGAGFGVIKALRVSGPESLRELPALLPFTSAFLLDAFDPKVRGGTGKAFSHELARPWIEQHPVFLAGGLTPENAGAVAREYRPFALDVSSGVEASPGLKDAARVKAFIQSVRDACAKEKTK